jgi:hypothetical protein
MLPEVSKRYISNVMLDGRFTELYAQAVIGEKETKELLIDFEREYSQVTKESNVDAIAQSLQKKTNRASILAQLRERKSETTQLESEKKSKGRNDHER